MDVYLAIGSDDYEGSYVLGVYSTVDGAVDACVSDVEETYFGHDDYDVVGYSIDVPEEKVIWSGRGKDIKNNGRAGGRFVKGYEA